MSENSEALPEGGAPAPKAKDAATVAPAVMEVSPDQLALLRFGIESIASRLVQGGGLEEVARLAKLKDLLDDAEGQIPEAARVRLSVQQPRPSAVAQPRG